MIDDADRTGRQEVGEQQKAIFWQWRRLLIQGGQHGQQRRRSAFERVTGYNWTGK